jgi:hypothetical protein
MGLRYRPGGLVFVSMNPGAGPQGGLSADDKRQYAALQRLRDADEVAALTAFDHSVCELRFHPAHHRQ